MATISTTLSTSFLPQRITEIQSQVYDLKNKFKIEKPIKVAIRDFAKSACAKFKDHSIRVPSWMLFKQEDIPSEFIIDDINDPRLYDRSFISRLADWMNTKIREANLSTICRSVDGGVLQWVVMLMKDRDLFEESKAFIIGHETAHLLQEQERIRKGIWQKTGTVIALLLGVLALVAIPLVHVGFAVGLGMVAVTVLSISLIQFKEGQGSGSIDLECERDADMRAASILNNAEGGIHYFNTKRLYHLKMCEVAASSITCHYDKEGNFLSDTKHPPLSDRVAYLRAWQTAHGRSSNVG